MINQKVITIVTPTYNRAYILDKCYESLKNQTSKLFLWMIIDDGSIDNTEELVKKWINEGEFEIIYYKKTNGGKASAINLSLNKLESKYFVCLDSDDTFTVNAVETALKQLEKISNNNNYCGILALRSAANGEVLGGKPIPIEVKETTSVELSNKYKIHSELICFYKTEIICQYRFPEVKGENFISPAYLEHEIGRKYKYYVCHDALCYCAYLKDGLTINKRKVIMQNPRGYTLVKRQSFELSNNFIAKSKHCIMYICGSILSNNENFIKESPFKLMTIIYYPLGWMVSILRFKLKKYKILGK